MAYIGARGRIEVFSTLGISVYGHGMCPLLGPLLTFSSFLHKILTHFCNAFSKACDSLWLL